MKSPFTAALLLTAIVLSQGISANAEKASTAASEEIADITGEWSFVAKTPDECSFTGVALLLPGETEDRFSCELTATQQCFGETWQVRQTCAATKVGDQLVITSTIEEFLQGEPDMGYKPDNFSLKIKSSDYMRGVLLSWGTHIAEFRRADGTIS